MATSRRDFLKHTGGVLGLAAAWTAQAVGASERVRLGIIGVGNRGGQLIEYLGKHADAEIIALCDVHKPFLDKWVEKLGGTPTAYHDFRELLDRKDIDAVVIATPDHWHAIQTIQACQAGKDVYVEKPLSLTIHEGRKMVEAARKYQRIVQMGVQRRSGEQYARLMQSLQDGLIGKITVARSYRITNMAPKGMGKGVDGAPPADLDWNLWLGPSPERPYRDTIAPYKFRWWKAYSSQLANWGVHFLDVIRWGMKEEAPEAVAALGGRFAVEDDRDIPDTLEVTWQLPSGGLAIFGQYEASGTRALKRGYVEFRGTRGTMYIGDDGYEIIPEEGGQFQERGRRMEAVEEKSEEGDLTVKHLRNFLDCVKSRAVPTADVEIGHRSTTFAHLGNIALATRSVIEWDGSAERIRTPESANEYLQYAYRSPWTLG